MASPKKKTVPGPSAAIVGFIPRIEDDPRRLPDGYADWALVHVNFVRRSGRILAMNQMFASGNDIPVVAGYADFRAKIASQDFRVAICLDDVEVTWDETTGRAAPKWRIEVEEGYTPDNTWTYHPPNWQYQNNGYRKGSKKFSTQVSATPTSLTLKLAARVKLWWAYNVAQAALTGYLAPWAIVKLKYTLHKNGNADIAFSGSAIPSQMYYVNWNAHAQHDMTTITAGQVRDFLEKGNCLDADLVPNAVFP